MDGSRTGFAELLTPAVPKFSPSGGSNENELNQDLLGSKNSKGFKKSPSPKKHFMSPTISAASKAFVPRKKVLAERNQAPDGEPTHFLKPFNLSPKLSANFSTICRKDAQSSTICSIDVQSCSIEIDDSGDQNDPSSKPYDPVTNYLSPRPTFLRYNPNRRYQLVLHSENEAGQRKCERDVQKGLVFDATTLTHEEAVRGDNYAYSNDSQGSSVSCSDESSVEEDGMIDVSENTGEKNNGLDVPKDFSFDTKKPCLEEVLGADTQGSSVSCVEEVSVSTDDEQIGKEDAENYDINEVVDEEEQEEIEVFEEESGWSFKGVLKFSFVIVSLILSTLYISSMNSPSLLTNPEARWGLKDQQHRFQYAVGLNASECASESSIDFCGKTEKGLLKFILGEGSYGFEGGNAIRDVKKEEGLVEIVDELGEVEAEVQDVQIEGTLGNESSCGEGSDQLQVPVTAKSKNEALDSIEVGSDQLCLTDFTQSEGFEYCKIEKAEDDKLSEREAGEISENIINSGSASDVEKMATEDIIEPVEEVSRQMLRYEVERAEDIDNNEVDDLNAGNGESEPQNPESNLINFPLGKEKFDSISAVAAGVPIIFTILASLGVVYYLRRKDVPVEESLSVDEPLVEPALAEKISTSLPSYVEEEESSDGAETFGSTSSLFRPVPEGVANATSHSQSHAPSVELLGELVIGEVSSSLRSHGAKSGHVEKEESHNLVSQTVVSSQAQANSYLKLSATDFGGSSTTEKKIVEKKGDKEAAESSTPVRRASRILPSPVRRSSRLRERSALFP